MKDQTEASNKFLQKKSFLERVWNRKESHAKTDKRSRSKISQSPTPSSASETISNYNDISDQIPNQETPTNNGEKELLEYNCLPPPRPIYTKSSSSINQVDSNPDEDFYDDVNTCRNQYNKNHQVIFYAMFI